MLRRRPLAPRRMLAQQNTGGASVPCCVWPLWNGCGRANNVIVDVRCGQQARTGNVWDRRSTAGSSSADWRAHSSRLEAARYVKMFLVFASWVHKLVAVRHTLRRHTAVDCGRQHSSKHASIGCRSASQVVCEGCLNARLSRGIPLTGTNISAQAMELRPPTLQHHQHQHLNKQAAQLLASQAPTLPCRLVAAPSSNPAAMTPASTCHSRPTHPTLSKKVHWTPHELHPASL